MVQIWSRCGHFPLRIEGIETRVLHCVVCSFQLTRACENATPSFLSGTSFLKLTIWLKIFVLLVRRKGLLRTSITLEKSKEEDDSVRAEFSMRNIRRGLELNWRLSFRGMRRGEGEGGSSTLQPAKSTLQPARCVQRCTLRPPWRGSKEGRRCL